MPRMPAPDSTEEDPKKKKKPELVVAIGMGPKTEGRKPPPGMDEAATGDPGDSTEEPKTPMGIDAGAGAGAALGNGKASPEEALAVREDHHCKDCSNWMPQTGECSAVDGIWAPEDACLRYFEAGSPGDEAEEPGTEAPGAEGKELGSPMGVPA